MFDLPGWCDCLFKDRRGTLTSPVHCVQALQGAQPEAQANQVWIFQEQDQLIGSSHLQGRCMTQQGEPKSCGQIHSTQDLHTDLSLLGFDGTLPRFSKGLMCITQPLHEHLSGEGASKKNKHVILTEDMMGYFKMLKKACLETSVLAFADFNKLFLLETDLNKLCLGAVLSQKQSDGRYHPVGYANCSLTIHKHHYHSTK